MKLEIKIICPPINLYIKPWQHAFDKRYPMNSNRHIALKIYWERSGKPQLQFKHGDDPWLDVAREPSWNPAFEYRISSTKTDAALRDKLNDLYHYGFKQGYDKATKDMLNLLRSKQCKSDE